MIITSAVVSAKAASFEVFQTAECEADLATLQVAVEAYVVSEGQAPETQLDLVDAGMLRSTASQYQLVDGRIELARGSSCPPPPGQERVIAVGPEPVDGDEPGTDDPGCAAASAVFDRLTAIGAASAGPLARELESIEQMIRTTASDLSPKMRTDLESLRLLLDTYRLQVVALDDRRSSADAPTARTIDDLEAGIAGYVSVIPAHEMLIWTMPNVAEQCETPYVPIAAMSVALNDFSAAINAFLGTDLGDDPEFAIFAELGPELAADLEGRSATSNLTDQFAACKADIRAASVGDNGGCDALYRACEDGDMAACNDLLYSTYLDTDYGRFGASCGGRARLGQIGYGGYCEEFSGS